MTTKEAAEFLFHPRIIEKVRKELDEYESKVPSPPPHPKKKSTSE